MGQPAEMTKKKKCDEVELNIQKNGSKAKPYQVKQVLKAINKLENEHGR